MLFLKINKEFREAIDSTFSSNTDHYEGEVVLVLKLWVQISPTLMIEWVASCWEGPDYVPLYTFIHNLLNVLVQFANKMGVLKRHCMSWH
jgi:hypothetical protein